ncbi:ATP-binding protein [Nonomuraea sp. NPDC050556]|uniref:ATP-binding protein n=1 Tax=Nonomuraea sp. NPDC050556 TaxID=3364369 RepID=UPI00378993FC
MTTFAARQQADTAPTPPEWLSSVLTDVDPGGYVAVFHRPAPVAAARRFVSTALTQWGLTETVFDTQLVASELVTNAIRHAGGALELLLVCRGAHLACAVSDESSAVPAAAAPDSYDEYGRGLQLVQALCSGWGWLPLDGPGKLVWAALR